MMPANGLSCCPAPPRRRDELRIDWGLIKDLILRRVSIEGTSTLTSISNTLKLSIGIVHDAFDELRRQQLVEVKGMVGEDYSFLLTAMGRELAAERFRTCQYAGPAPVSLSEYHSAVRAQAVKVKLNLRMLRDALSDLVVNEQLLQQLGPALVSQTSVFIYGPTGNGKTSIAERLTRIYHDAVLVPYAIEVDRQIVTIYDPIVHRRQDGNYPDLDNRWVVCGRPCLIVGGELTSTMLELRHDDVTKIYVAPTQVKANNGILIIDDFGRQVMSPRELLNRWIVPLDRRIDYLTLRYGLSFEVPFELMVAFSTNLEPASLADEAFFRRIRSKVYIGPVSDDDFDEVFRRVAQARDLCCGPGTAAQLRRACMREGRGELRACYPEDICDLLVWTSAFEERPVRISEADIERAANLYFGRRNCI